MIVYKLLYKDDNGSLYSSNKAPSSAPSLHDLWINYEKEVYNEPLIEGSYLFAFVSEKHAKRWFASSHLYKDNCELWKCEALDIVRYVLPLNCHVMWNTATPDLRGTANIAQSTKHFAEYYWKIIEKVKKAKKSIRSLMNGKFENCVFGIDGGIACKKIKLLEKIEW